MARYALIDAANVVQNMVAWDGDTSKWNPPAGFTAVNVEGIAVDIGWTWSGGTSFTFGQLPSQILAVNAATIRSKLDAAEADMSALITQGQTLLAKADYTAANLAAALVALNDLLHTVQQIVGGPQRDGTGGVMLIAQDLRWVARQLLGQFDGTT